MKSRSDSLQNYKLTIRYDGQAFFGWQRQDPKPTVQLAIEHAIKKCWGRQIHLHGSGRTDRGVHANAQVASFSAEPKFGTRELLHALNNNLPPHVRITAVKPVPSSFHARFSAKGKEYQYRVSTAPFLDPFIINRVWHLPRPFNLGLIREALPVLIGTHDFASFASNPGYERETTVRTLYRAQVNQQQDLVTFTFRGNGFLFRMVRNLVGALAKVGHARISPDEFHEILTSRSRQAAPNTAPPDGLYLNRVFYRNITPRS